MAKIVVELDTETNKITADVGGTKIDDIDSVSFYRYCCNGKEQLSFCLSQKVKKDEDGMSSYTSYNWCTPYDCNARASEIKVTKNTGNLEKSIASLFKK